MKFILDTNIVTAYIKNQTPVFDRLSLHHDENVYLTPPVYYEVIRGLRWKKATAKLSQLQRLRMRLGWLQLIDEDWDKAAHLWSDAVSKGRRLSDVDLLLVALALRLNAILVSADVDFDVFSVTRENWLHS